MMKVAETFLFLFLAAVCSSTVFGQQTVNVSPGDNLQAALQQAGAGGTVVFAPGVYELVPNPPSADAALMVPPELEEITLQGAGTGFDPQNATIIDGNFSFLGTGIQVNAFGTQVEGITFVNFYNSNAFVEGTENVEFRNCWFVGGENCILVSGQTGFFDPNTPNDFSFMIRFFNCVIYKGGDGVQTEDQSAVLLWQCDLKDFSGDIIEAEQESTVLIRNSIIHTGIFSDDIQSEQSTTIDIQTSVLFKPGIGDGTVDSLDRTVENGSNTIDSASIFADPLYVNAAANTRFREADFRLQAGSPALDIGRDSDGNTIFAGSQGPAQ